MEVEVRWWHGSIEAQVEGGNTETPIHLEEGSAGGAAMISALGWVPRGAPKARPRPDDLTMEEAEGMVRVRDQWERQRGDGRTNGSEDESTDEDEEEDPAKAVSKAKQFAKMIQAEGGKDDVMDAMAELNMDAYDEDGDEERISAARIFGSGRPGDMAFRSNEEDPYMKHNTWENDRDSDEEDFDVKDTDLMLLAARNEDDVSHLEAWIFEEEGEDGDHGNLYVHHDIMLPSFPLALCWMDWVPRSNGTQKGNLVAVSTFEPAIELWNLDMIDVVEPVGVLGGIDIPLEEAFDVSNPDDVDKKAKKKASRKKKKQVDSQAHPSFRAGSHEDAVMSLSWNNLHRNILASGSADNTVKVWDLQKLACICTGKHHTGKVQSVAWSPTDGNRLLTGSYDKTAAVVDTRESSQSKNVWNLSADVEQCAWDIHNPQYFVVSMEDGSVNYYDTRQGKKGKPLWRLAAHSKPVCSVSFCWGCTSLMATSSIDKTVKFWDISDNKPELVSTIQPKQGALFAATFCKDQPFLFAAGGEKGSMKVWDIRIDSSLEKLVTARSARQ